MPSKSSRSRLLERVYATQSREGVHYMLLLRTQALVRSAVACRLKVKKEESNVNY